MADKLSKKILIADDEAYIRLLIEQTLEDLEGREVELITARDGLEALGLIREQKPRLVFLDVMMPKMSGFDVCRAAKHAPGAEGVYIVMLTAKGQESDRQVSEEAGADYYMTKPFDPDELLDLAVKVLAG
jgi:DNA-binding response OmpR family regulator